REHDLPPSRHCLAELRAQVPARRPCGGERREPRERPAPCRPRARAARGHEAPHHSERHQDGSGRAAESHRQQGCVTLQAFTALPNKKGALSQEERPSLVRPAFAAAHSRSLNARRSSGAPRGPRLAWGLNPSQPAPRKRPRSLFVPKCRPAANPRLCAYGKSVNLRTNRTGLLTFLAKGPALVLMLPVSLGGEALGGPAVYRREGTCFLRSWVLH